MPSSSRTFAINAAWLSVVMLAVDLIAWTQLLLLHDDLEGRTQDAAPPAAPRRRPTHPRPAPALAAHPALVALGRIREPLAALTTPLE